MGASVNVIVFIHDVIILRLSVTAIFAHGQVVGNGQLLEFERKKQGGEGGRKSLREF